MGPPSLPRIRRLTQAELQLTKAFTEGDLAPNTYKSEIAQLRAKRHDVANITSLSVSQAQLQETVHKCLQLATSFWDLYQPLSEIRKAMLLKNLFKTVVVDHTGIVGFVLKSPFSELCRASGDNLPMDLATAILRTA